MFTKTSIAEPASIQGCTEQVWSGVCIDSAGAGENPIAATHLVFMGGGGRLLGSDQRVILKARLG